MSRMRVWTIIGVALSVAGLGIWGVRGLRAPGPRAGLALAYDWPRGTEYLYDLRHTAATNLTLDVGGTTAGGRSELDGTLRIRSHGPHQGATLLGLSFLDLRRQRLEVLGKNLLPEASAAAPTMAGQEALALVEASGRVRSIHFDPHAPEVFRHVVQWLLPEILVELPARAAARWEGQRETSLGRVEEAHELVASEPAVIARRGLRYRTLRALGDSGPQDLQASARLALAPGGHPQQLEGREELTAGGESGGRRLTSQSQLRLALMATRAFTPEPDVPAQLQAAEVRRPGEVVMPAAAARQALEDRVGGLTWDQLLGDLRRLGEGAQIPDRHRWVWQATGLLLRDSAECRRLGDLFPLPNASARALVFDLLAAAGHGDAQRVMRELLARPELDPTKEDGAVLLQRFSVVATPARETVELVAEVRARAARIGQVGPERSAAYVLGANVRALARSGQEDLARVYNQRLVDDLARAGSTDARVAALHALGNAAQEWNVPGIVSHSADGDAGVRRATAIALRHTATPEARAVLLRLGGDVDPRVQAAALSALGRQPPEGEVLVELRSLVVGRRVSRRNHPAILNIAARHLEAGEGVRPLLEAVAAAAEAEPSVRARALAMLEQISG